MLDYITKEDTIIFSPEYNKPLEPKLLLNYKKIIFSDYELNDTLFDAYKNSNLNCNLNNNLIDKYKNLKYKNLNFKKSEFNQPLDNSLHDLTSLTHLIFGLGFEQPLNNSLDK